MRFGRRREFAVWKKQEEIKTAREIAQMRKAGLLVWEALRLAKSMIRPDTTTREIDAAVARFFAEHHATPLFKNFPNPDAGGPPFPAVTCISINEEVVHGIPGPRKLAEGDIVSIDTGCKLNGWCGDAAATYPVGQITPPIRRLLDVTRGVLSLAIELAGKCRRWNEVAAEMEAYVKRQRFSVVDRYVGHGIGREMHEDPRVANCPVRGGDFRLEPGLVIAVEPMVNTGTKRVTTLTDRWTVVTADRKPSAHFEHTIALADSGPMILTLGPHGEDIW